MTAPGVARALGYLGLLPFVGAVAGIWFAPPPVRAVSFLALGTYGAVVLSFVGAVHWGRLLADEPAAPGWFVWSVVPALVGWGALLLSPALGLSALIGGLVVAWAVDRAATRQGRFPPWYGALRGHLTAAAALALAAAVPAFV